MFRAYYSDRQLLSVSSLPKALDIARLSMKRLAEHFEQAFDCLEDCFEQYYSKRLKIESRRITGLVDPEIFKTQIGSFISKLGEKESFDQESLQRGYRLIISFYADIKSVCDLIPERMKTADVSIGRKYREAKGHLVQAGNELSIVEALTCSFEKIDPQIVRAPELAVAKSFDLDLENKAAAVDQSDLCNIGQLRSFLLRRDPHCILAKRMLLEGKGAVCTGDIVLLISDAFGKSAMNDSDLESLKSVFRYFDNSQRQRIGTYLCNAISPDFYNRSKNYIKLIEDFAITLCKETNSSIYLASALERLSGFSRRIKGLNLSPLVNNNVFSIQNNGAVLLQRVRHSYFNESSSIAAVTPFGLLPIFSGEIGDKKWQHFSESHEIKKIPGLTCAAMTGGLADYYQLGIAADGSSLPDVRAVPLDAAVPFYYSIFILEALRSNRRARAFADQ